MRSRVRWIPVILVLGSASAVLAQEEERPRLVKPEGDREDNQQLGGEPSLTETKPGATGKVDGEPDLDTKETECDLDCIEAQLKKDEERGQKKKSILTVGKETGSIGEESPENASDALAAEPSTTSLAEVAAEAPEKRRLPTRLGPVRIRIGKTDDWIGIGFAAQLEFEYDQQLEGGGVPKDSTETLQFRRIRTTLSSSFIDGRIRSAFQINLTPSAFELIDMWLSFTRFKFATFRIGQFKIPYDRYRAQSFAALSFIDWSPTTRMFGSERQIGMETLASGGFLDLEYALGLFSGTNARASHGVGIAEVYGEIPRNPSTLGAGEIVSEFHPAIVGRVAKNFGEINTDTNTDVLGAKELRHSLGVGFAWDARPNPIENLGLRLSAEWLGKIRFFDINVISYLAWYKPWQGGKILFGPMGFMAEVGYRFSRLWELALRYSITYLTPWLRSDARSYGDFQIANATDPAAAIAQYGANGDQITNDQLALAGTAHIIGNSLKTVAELAWESQLWAEGRRNGVRLSLQLQFLF
ncbi:MAG: hypothetical protein WBM46_16460 [Polyangiales bacterium]